MDIWEVIGYIMQALGNASKASRERRDERRTAVRGQLTQALELLRARAGDAAGAPPPAAAAPTPRAPAPVAAPVAPVRAPAVPPPLVVPVPAPLPVARLFMGPQTVAAAIIAAEVLGPPVAFRRI
ncbi:MAG: hypothetical protein ABR591_04420 [Candidatus Velthaea sp.]